jgi:hypothetical protein
MAVPRKFPRFSLPLESLYFFLHKQTLKFTLAAIYFDCEDMPLTLMVAHCIWGQAKYRSSFLGR